MKKITREDQGRVLNALEEGGIVEAMMVFDEADRIRLAADFVGHVLPIIEDVFPDDRRPRGIVELARKYAESGKFECEPGLLAEYLSLNSDDSSEFDEDTAALRLDPGEPDRHSIHLGDVEIHGVWKRSESRYFAATNGQGAAERLLEILEKGSDVDSLEILLRGISWTVSDRAGWSSHGLRESWNRARESWRETMGRDGLSRKRFQEGAERSALLAGVAARITVADDAEDREGLWQENRIRSLAGLPLLEAPPAVEIPGRSGSLRLLVGGMAAAAVVVVLVVFGLVQCPAPGSEHTDLVSVLRSGFTSFEALPPHYLEAVPALEDGATLASAEDLAIAVDEEHSDALKLLMHKVSLEKDRDPRLLRFYDSIINDPTLTRSARLGALRRALQLAKHHGFREAFILYRAHPAQFIRDEADCFVSFNNL